jgi:hypothetical protein
MTNGKVLVAGESSDGTTNSDKLLATAEVFESREEDVGAGVGTVCKSEAGFDLDLSFVELATGERVAALSSAVPHNRARPIVAVQESIDILLRERTATGQKRSAQNTSFAKVKAAPPGASLLGGTRWQRIRPRLARRRRECPPCLWAGCAGGRFNSGYPGDRHGCELRAHC